MKKESRECPSGIRFDNLSGVFHEKEEDRLSELVALFYKFFRRFSSFFETKTSSVYPVALTYASGLLLSIKRNIERINEAVPDFNYDQLRHFISYSPWNHQPISQEIGRSVSRAFQTAQASGGPVGLLIDPTTFLKKGNHSAGVKRQWSGRAGKIENCQKAVMAALSRGVDVALFDYLLYLPKDWTQDPERCDLAGIPEDQREYQTAGQLAMTLVQRADDAGVAYDWVGMDSEFGKPWIMERLDEMGKTFLIDIPKSFSVYRHHPKLSFKPKKATKKGRAFRKKPKATKVEDLVSKFRGRCWKRVVVRDAAKGPLVIDLLHRTVWVLDAGGTPRRRHLVVRRETNGGKKRLKYSLSNAPSDTDAKTLAYHQAQRFWIEHAFKDDKSHLGLAEYQVRQWRAWHHHMAMALIVGLFMLEARLEHREAIPLLTVSDIRYVMQALLPRPGLAEVITHVMIRHDQRRADIEAWKARYNRRE